MSALWSFQSFCVLPHAMGYPIRPLRSLLVVLVSLVLAPVVAVVPASSRIMTSWKRASLQPAQSSVATKAAKLVVAESNVSTSDSESSESEDDERGEIPMERVSTHKVSVGDAVDSRCPKEAEEDDKDSEPKDDVNSSCYCSCLKCKVSHVVTF